DFINTLAQLNRGRRGWRSWRGWRGLVCCRRLLLVRVAGCRSLLLVSLARLLCGLVLLDFQDLADGVQHLVRGRRCAFWENKFQGRIVADVLDGVGEERKNHAVGLHLNVRHPELLPRNKCSRLYRVRRRMPHHASKSLHFIVHAIRTLRELPVLIGVLRRRRRCGAVQQQAIFLQNQNGARGHDVGLVVGRLCQRVLGDQLLLKTRRRGRGALRILSVAMNAESRHQEKCSQCGAQFPSHRKTLPAESLSGVPRSPRQIRCGPNTRLETERSAAADRCAPGSCSSRLSERRHARGGDTVVSSRKGRRLAPRPSPLHSPLAVASGARPPRPGRAEPASRGRQWLPWRGRPACRSSPDFPPASSFRLPSFPGTRCACPASRSRPRKSEPRHCNPSSGCRLRSPSHCCSRQECRRCASERLPETGSNPSRRAAVR